jgi:SAM-dependent methyltransferase
LFTLGEAHSVSSYYQGLLKRYPLADAQCVGWNDTQSQLLRFSALMGVGSFANCSVLDVGCGPGHLYEFLQKHNPPAQYTGLDMIAQSVELARNSYPQAQFLEGVFPEYTPQGHFDYVVASGLFCLNIHHAKKKYWESLNAMFELCHKGIAFNCLNALVPVKNPFYQAFKAQEIYQMCKRISPFLVLREDYLERDFTIYIYKTNL